MHHLLILYGIQIAEILYGVIFVQLCIKICFLHVAYMYMNTGISLLPLQCRKIYVRALDMIKGWVRSSSLSVTVLALQTAYIINYDNFA